MRYRFGDYVLDDQRHELQHAGTPIKLRRKVFQVLVYLLAHRDRVVSKQELLEQVWPNQFVGDEALKSCITALRKTLQEQGRTPRFVRTLHGQGYRFVGTVEVREHLQADDTPAALLGRGGEGATRPAEDSSPDSSPAPAAPLVDLNLPPWEGLGGEYKQVTVLCGALAEAPTLAARLGPEAMHHLMHDVLALAQNTVQRYEGTLTHLSGEGFMALFGAPVAHEDHARRAVLAAIELRQRLHRLDAIRGQPHRIGLRLGLHTGPVVVGPLAYAPQQPYTAAGEALQHATQLQQQAAADMLLVSAATYALVQEEVEGEVCTSVSIAVPGYAIRGLKHRRAGIPRRGARPLSPFVGRREELALLQARLALALGGQGQVVGIAGEPGLGKSRLLAEFRSTLHGQALTWCEGHCLPYGLASPYRAVRELLRHLWDLPNAVPEPTITAMVQHRLREAGLASDDEALVLLRLLGLPVDRPPWVGLDQEARRARTFALLRHLIRHASQQQPLVLVVENLHWIDPTSEAWLGSLAEPLADLSALILATYRPGYQPPWLGHSAATQMALPRLSPGDSLVVLRSVPQAAELPVRIHEAIVAKAAGNPFFIEELSWVAVAHGDPAHPLPLPDTIEAVLAARLDRLPPETKHLLQAASVIGSEVPVPLLQRLVGMTEEVLLQNLAHLQRLEFLYETALVPEQTYTFKHALTREVAYGSLLHERRRALHECTAQAIEALYAQQLDNHVGELAHHYRHSGNSAKAVYYCQRAGEQAIQRSADAEAVRHLNEGLALLATLPETPARAQWELDLQMALGPALIATQGMAAPEVECTYARARTVCAQVGETPQLFLTLWGLWRFYRGRGALLTALELGEQLYWLAQREAVQTFRLEAHDALGSILFDIGEYTAAWTHFEQGIALIDTAAQCAQVRTQGLAPGVQCLALAAITLWCLGYPEQALRRSQEAQTLAQALAHPYSQAMTQFYAAGLHHRRREAPAVQAQAEALLALATAQGFPLWDGYGTCWRGWALAMQHRDEADLLQLRQGTAAVLATGQELSRPLCLILLAEAAGHADQVADGLTRLAEARSLLEGSGRGDLLAEAYRLQGELLLRQSVADAEPAEACFQQALAISRRQQAKSWELRAAMSLSRLWQRQGKRSKAYELLAPIYGWFTEGFDTADLQEARALLEELS